MRVLLIVAAMALAASACDSGAPDSSDGSKDDSAVTSEASAEQLASKLSTYQREVGQIIDELADSDCAGEDAQVPVCMSILDRSTSVAESVVIVIDGGRPAAEIEALAGDTRDAAQAVVDAHREWDGNGCQSSAGDECESLTSELREAVEQLHKQFDAWSPYMP